MIFGEKNDFEGLAEGEELKTNLLQVEGGSPAYRSERRRGLAATRIQTAGKGGSKEPPLHVEPGRPGVVGHQFKGLAKGKMR